MIHFYPGTLIRQEFFEAPGGKRTQEPDHSKFLGFVLFIEERTVRPSYVGNSETSSAPVLRPWIGSTVLAVGIRYCYLAAGPPAISLSTRVITHFINYYLY